MLTFSVSVRGMKCNFWPSFRGRPGAITRELVQTLVNSIIDDWQHTDIEKLEKQYAGMHHVNYIY